MTQAEPTPDSPLYVDLDGTLIPGDSLIHCIGLLIRQRPWILPVLPLFLLRGRAAFKDHIARRVAFDPARLPYRPTVQAFLETQRRTGRRLILATASHRLIAEEVAGHLDLFDGIIASDGSQNLKGRAKLAAITSHADGHPFSYMGDSMVDVPIFQAARTAILVAPSRRLLAIARATCHVESVFD